jgi:hypothetical protein
MAKGVKGFPKDFMGRLVNVLIRREERDRLVQPEG